eukprot:Awhi_evm2s3831
MNAQQIQCIDVDRRKESYILFGQALFSTQEKEKFVVYRFRNRIFSFEIFGVKVELKFHGHYIKAAQVTSYKRLSFNVDLDLFLDNHKKIWRNEELFYLLDIIETQFGKVHLVTGTQMNIQLNWKPTKKNTIRKTLTLTNKADDIHINLYKNLPPLNEGFLANFISFHFISFHQNK